MASKPTRSSHLEPQYLIRPARTEDLETLPAIEISAATAFKVDPELAFLAQDEPTSAKEHEASVEAWQTISSEGSGIWVAVLLPNENASQERVVGFITTSLELDANRRYYIHIHELSVHQEHQRKGLARRLMETVKESGRDRNVIAVLGLTLTTMRDLPFNKHFYKKLGFREYDPNLIEAAFGPWAKAIWDQEQERLASIKHRRCFMGYLV